jgi:hypothetical protein
MWKPAAQLAEDASEVQALQELDGATNARLLGEQGLLAGIGVHELLYGVRYSEIVNAAPTALSSPAFATQAEPALPASGRCSCTAYAATCASSSAFRRGEPSLRDRCAR